MFAGGTGGVLTIVRLALAVPPLPPSFDVTAPVTLFCTPEPVASTLTVKLHEAAPARLAPTSATLAAPAVAVMVPPPQLPVRPFGVATTNPAGSTSVKPTPVNVVAAFVLLSVNVSVVVALGRSVDVPNAFAIVAGVTAATVTLALAVLPVPPLADPTAPVTLFLAPLVVPVTLTEN